MLSSKKRALAFTVALIKSKCLRYLPWRSSVHCHGPHKEWKQPWKASEASARNCNTAGGRNLFLGDISVHWAKTCRQAVISSIRCHGAGRTSLRGWNEPTSTNLNKCIIQTSRLEKLFETARRLYFSTSFTGRKPRIWRHINIWGSRMASRDSSLHSSTLVLVSASGPQGSSRYLHHVYTSESSGITCKLLPLSKWGAAASCPLSSNGSEAASWPQTGAGWSMLSTSRGLFESP